MGAGESLGPSKGIVNGFGGSTSLVLPPRRDEATILDGARVGRGRSRPWGGKAAQDNRGYWRPAAPRSGVRGTRARDDATSGNPGASAWPGARAPHGTRQ
jgi:hypothetical protein